MWMGPLHFLNNDFHQAHTIPPSPLPPSLLLVPVFSLVEVNMADGPLHGSLVAVPLFEVNEGFECSLMV